MEEHLNVILVEDNPNDVKLLKAELGKSYDLDIHETDNKEEYCRELESFPADIILSDYKLPHFDGMEALKIHYDIAPHIPFILVTGSMNEEVAVEVMKAGAEDYIIKEHLYRLTPAIKSAIEKKRNAILKERAEKALQESEEKFRSIFNTMTSALCLDKIIYENGQAVDYQILDVNPAYERILNISREKAVGSLASGVYGLGEAPFLDTFAKVAQTGNPATFEAYFPPAEKYLQITASCPQKGYFSTVFSDVTGKKKLEQEKDQALEHEKQRAYEMEMLLRGAKTVLQDGDFAATSRKIFDMAREMTGAPAGYVALLNEDGSENELLFLESGGQPCDVDHDLPMPVRGLRNKAYKTGKAVFENDFMNSPWVKYMPEGHVVLKNVLFAPLSIKGKTVGVIGLANKPEDFTKDDVRVCEAFGDLAALALQDYKSHDALIKSEQRFRSLVESAPDAIFIQTKQRFAYLNKALLKLLKARSADDILGKPVLDFFHPEDHDTVRERIRLLNKERKPVGINEETMLTFTGENVPVEVTAVPFEYGGDHGALVFVRDTSERKRLEKQLLQSQKMEAVGKLAGGVAHDFNNLLTVISGYSDMLLAGMDRSAPHFEKILQIKQAGQRASLLTSQLLAFSRKQILKPEIIDVNKLIRDTQKMLQRLIGEDIDLETFLCNEPAVIEADVGQMEQIIMNLAVNARDAMPTGGKLTIETQIIHQKEKQKKMFHKAQNNAYVLIAISDNGVGMEKSVQEHIFEPFFTTKEKGKGTGLGLSTVYGIVKQSGGDISVYSEPDKGTTFTLYFPVVKQQKRKKRKDKSERDFNLEGSETILIVEDDEDVRELVVNTVKSYGYNIIQAENGSEAIEKAKTCNEKIDLLLSDVVMPSMSGKELSEKIQEIHPETLVCFMSGYTDDAIVHHGVLEKDVNFIQKPFTPKVLVSKIRTLLDNRS